MSDNAVAVSPAVRAILDRSGVLKSTRVIADLHDELRKEQSTFEPILKAIAADQPLARRVIDIANSAWFGGRIKVDTVEVAFGRLGVEDFYKAVVAGALRFHVGDGAEFKPWWTQSETTSRLAELIAQHLDPALIEASFFLGLLHDCAVPLLWKLVPDYSYLAAEALGFAPGSVEMETECNQVNHCEVGAALVQAWKFPPHFAGILLHHHSLTLEGLSDDAGRRQLGLLLLTKRIDHWCTHEVTPGFADASEENLELEIANVFRLTRGQLREVISEMVRMYQLRKNHA